MSGLKALTYAEVADRQAFFASNLPATTKELYKEQVESAKAVLENPDAYPVEVVQAKAQSLNDITYRLEVAYEAQQSLLKTQKVLSEIR